MSSLAELEKCKFFCLSAFVVDFTSRLFGSAETCDGFGLFLVFFTEMWFFGTVLMAKAKENKTGILSA